MNIYTVAFFGHRYITDPFRAEALLEERIRALLREKMYVDFLVGRNGEFDQLVSSTIRRLQRTCRDDNSSLCLMLPYVTAEYRNNQESFEDCYDSIEVSYEASKARPKAAMQIRNREMVDRAELIICCVERESGGAYQTVQYARKAGKPISNLAELIPSKNKHLPPHGKQMQNLRRTNSSKDTPIHIIWGYCITIRQKNQSIWTDLSDKFFQTVNGGVKCCDYSTKNGAMLLYWWSGKWS